MLKYKFIEDRMEGALYEFYPEGNVKSPGIVLLKDGEGKIITKSEDDVGNRYAFHAIRGIDRSTKEGTVAWY